MQVALIEISRNVVNEAHASTRAYMLFHPLNWAARKPPLKSALILARIVAALTILDDVDILDGPVEQG